MGCGGMIDISLFLIRGLGLESLKWKKKSLGVLLIAIDHAICESKLSQILMQITKKEKNLTEYDGIEDSVVFVSHICYMVPIKQVEQKRIWILIKIIY